MKKSYQLSVIGYQGSGKTKLKVIGYQGIGHGAWGKGHGAEGIGIRVPGSWFLVQG